MNLKELIEKEKEENENKEIDPSSRNTVLHTNQTNEQDGI